MKVKQNYINLRTGETREEIFEATENNYVYQVLKYEQHRFFTIGTQRGGLVTYTRIDD